MNEGRVRCPYDFSETDAMIGLLLEYGVQTTRMTLASALLTYLVLHYFLLYSRGSLKGEKHDTVLF
jgi:hypothetical protein